LTMSNWRFERKSGKNERMKRRTNESKKSNGGA
jgi:hypothetical protein